MTKAELIEKATEEALLDIDRSIQKSMEWVSIDDDSREYVVVAVEVRNEVKKRVAKKIGEQYDLS